MSNFQGIYWIQKEDGSWSREMTDRMYIGEMAAFMRANKLVLAWRLPQERPTPGYISVSHVHSGRISEEHAEFLGGYRVPPAVYDKTRTTCPPTVLDEIDKQAMARVDEMVQRKPLSTEIFRHERMLKHHMERGNA